MQFTGSCTTLDQTRKQLLPNRIIHFGKYQNEGNKKSSIFQKKKLPTFEGENQNENILYYIYEIENIFC